MTISPRAYFAAGALFFAGSLGAGLVQCGEDATADAWRTQLSSPAVRQASASVVPVAVPEDARCAVCGMYPARFPHWAAQLVLKDGSRRWFESPRELLVFLRDLDRHGKGVKSDELVAAFVTDFGGAGWVRATDAFFVRGSRQRGPMGADAFPAFGKRTAAVALVGEQGGEVVDWNALVTAFAGEGDAAAAHHHHAP